MYRQGTAEGYGGCNGAWQQITHCNADGMQVYGMRVPVVGNALLKGWRS